VHGRCLIYSLPVLCRWFETILPHRVYGGLIEPMTEWLHHTENFNLTIRGKSHSQNHFAFDMCCTCLSSIGGFRAISNSHRLYVVLWLLLRRRSASRSDCRSKSAGLYYTCATGLACTADYTV
jgi:hypothetical protein